eukprot:4709269-Amphidinium_carterae.1
MSKHSPEACAADEVHQSYSLFTDGWKRTLVMHPAGRAPPHLRKCCRTCIASTSPWRWPCQGERNSSIMTEALSEAGNAECSLSSATAPSEMVKQAE